MMGQWHLYNGGHAVEQKVINRTRERRELQEGIQCMHIITRKEKALAKMKRRETRQVAQAQPKAFFGTFADLLQQGKVS